MLEEGCIYIIYCNYINPPHDKICLCFNATDRLFFFVNSRPRLPLDAQEPVSLLEHSALSHDSFIDLSSAKTFSPLEVARAAERGALSAAVVQRVRARLVTGAKTLPPRYRTLALDGLK